MALYQLFSQTNEKKGPMNFCSGEQLQPQQKQILQQAGFTVVDNSNIQSIGHVSPSKLGQEIAEQRLTV